MKCHMYAYVIAQSSNKFIISINYLLVKAFDCLLDVVALSKLCIQRLSAVQPQVWNCAV